MASGTEFETADLDSVINVIGLTPSDPLDTFVEIWYQVFLWALFSSLFVHFVAAVVAFSMLRKQQIGRFTPLLILLMGLVAPLTGGALTKRVSSLGKIAYADDSGEPATLKIPAAPAINLRAVYNWWEPWESIIFLPFTTGCQR
ncbi:uncharacterized protein LOC119177048 isoform X1 [Rhipicephalus microplus]|uniref:uncharacterized protein LOC119177048 isoform X1 n=1 Tax=Rhipicephalus microplus TaxID=6941 RepID=UPI001886FC16|nr:uncharacterized protein LOC119177048 isoform X1 [Rhipicephalus microplus]